MKDEYPQRELSAAIIGAAMVVLNLLRPDLDDKDTTDYTEPTPPKQRGLRRLDGSDKQKTKRGFLSSGFFIREIRSSVVDFLSSFPSAVPSQNACAKKSSQAATNLAYSSERFAHETL